jgi:hypothetical protein
MALARGLAWLLAVKLIRTATGFIAGFALLPNCQRAVIPMWEPADFPHVGSQYLSDENLPLMR